MPNRSSDGRSETGEATRLMTPAANTLSCVDDDGRSTGPEGRSMADFRVFSAERTPSPPTSIPVHA